MNGEIDEYIAELRHTVVQAKLNYEIWWLYKSKDSRPKYVKAMRRYNMFFQTSIHAHFVSLLVELYRLYETRKDTFNIPNLLKKLRKSEQINEKELIILKKMYENEAKPLWIKVNILRNKAFGHRSRAHTVEEVFKEAGIKPEELEKLVEITEKFINKLSLSWSDTSHIFNLSARNDTLRLLEDINKNG